MEAGNLMKISKSSWHYKWLCLSGFSEDDIKDMTPGLYISILMISPIFALLEFFQHGTIELQD
jgi:hypothetical protein